MFQMQRSIFILFFLVLSIAIFAQAPEKKDKEEKPDSVKAFVFSSYVLDENNRKIYMPLDTVFDAPQVYSPLEKLTPSWTAQTNLGQGVRSNEFFARTQNAEFIFWQPYEPYWADANETKYYNLNNPYTDVSFSRAQRGSGHEQVIKILHTRNFSDNFNLGVRYNVISAPGLNGHRNRAKHSRFEGFFKYTGLRYRIHASGSSTKVETQHNGGFVDGKYYFDRDSVELTLTTAGEVSHDFQIYADQEYLIGPKDSIRYKDRPAKAVVKAWASIRHKIHYRRNYRIFSDTDLGTESIDGIGDVYTYYPNAFLNNSSTLDSLYFNQFKNTLDFEIKEGFVPSVNFGLRVGLVHEMSDVYNFRDYIFIDQNTDDYYSFGVTAALFNRVSDYWSWKGNAHLMLDGYKKDDVSVKGEINRYFFSKNDSSLIRLKAEMSRIRPSYFFNNFYSNHYIWENNFAKEENIRAGLHYVNPSLRLDVGVDAQQTNNFVYFGTDGMPTQTSQNMLTYAVSIRKKFTFFKHLGFNNVLIYQRTTNPEVLHIPEWITHQSLFYDRSLFSDALRFQLGVDFTMTAKFKGAYFNPAIGMYQIQNEKEVGEFPVISAFLNLRIQSARVFLKFNNIYQYINNEWFFTSAYAIDSVSMFRFGVNWYFAD